MTSMRKYLDADRVIVNPEWLAAREATKIAIAREAPDQLASIGIEPSTYFPEQYDKLIPETGAWILVLDEPLTELRNRFRVPLLSMWRARSHVINDGGFSFPLGTRNTQFTARPHQAVIATPGGDLHLWPHEYVIVRDPMSLIGDESAEMHHLGGEPVLDADHMFYLQSRGIAHTEAVLLLFDAITAADYIYVTFPEAVTATLEGVGMPLWHHINSARESA